MNSESKQSKPNEGAFIKSLIKINNPTWNAAQIDAEYQRKIKEVQENPDDCEMCSG